MKQEGSQGGGSLISLTKGLDDSLNGGDKLNTSKQHNAQASILPRSMVRQTQATPKQSGAGKISAETMTRKQEALLKNRLKNLVKYTFVTKQEQTR